MQRPRQAGRGPRTRHGHGAEMWGAVRRPGSLRPRAHGDTRLLRDGLQHLTLDRLRDERQLLAQRLVAVAHADVWHIGAADVIALGALLGVVGSQPVALYLQGEEVTGGAAAGSEGPCPRTPRTSPNTEEGRGRRCEGQAGGRGTLWEKPLMSTLLRASSHMSQELSFHTWVAMLYSSISGSCTGQVPSDRRTKPCHLVPPQGTGHQHAVLYQQGAALALRPGA